MRTFWIVVIITVVSLWVIYRRKNSFQQAIEAVNNEKKAYKASKDNLIAVEAMAASENIEFKPLYQLYNEVPDGPLKMPYDQYLAMHDLTPSPILRLLGW